MVTSGDSWPNWLPPRTGRRDEVANAAMDAIAEVGLDGASIREVAARLGTTIGVVTHQFRDRDALLAYVFHLAVANIAERSARSGDHPDPRKALRNSLTHALPLDDQSRRETAVWLTFSAAAMTRRELADQHRLLYDEWTKVIVAYLRRCGIRAGATRTARSLIAVVDGLALRACSGMSEGSIVAELDDAVDAFLLLHQT